MRKYSLEVGNPDGEIDDYGNTNGRNKDSGNLHEMEMI